MGGLPSFLFSETSFAQAPTKRTKTPHTPEKRSRGDKPTMAAIVRTVGDKLMGSAAKMYQNVLGSQLAQYGA